MDRQEQIRARQQKWRDREFNRTTEETRPIILQKMIEQLERENERLRKELAELN